MPVTYYIRKALATELNNKLPSHLTQANYFQRYIDRLIKSKKPRCLNGTFYFGGEPKKKQGQQGEDCLPFQCYASKFLGGSKINLNILK